MANWKRTKFETGTWGDQHTTSLDWKQGRTYFAKRAGGSSIHLYSGKPKTKGSAVFEGEVRDSEASPSYRYFVKKSDTGKVVLCRTKRVGTKMKKEPKPSKTKPRNVVKRTTTRPTAGLKTGRPKRSNPRGSSVSRQLSLLPLLNALKR